MADTDREAIEVEGTIKEGLEHLKLNYEFYGRFGGNV